MSRRLLASGIGVCIVASAGLAGCGSGSGPKPTSRFWGVVPQARTSLAQLERLRRGGIGTVRIGVDWRLMQRRARGSIRWTDVDEIVANATRAGLTVLPYVYESPPWVASDGRTLPVHDPRQEAAWESFLAKVVKRYGPGGRFWAAHPNLAPRPLRTWQIWNEPNFFYFAKLPSPADYDRLVRLSRRAIDRADPGAELLLAGLFALPAEKPPRAFAAYRFLELMHREDPHIWRLVDGVALHPYTRNFHYLRPIVGQVRAALRRAGDPDAPLWITELGWGSQSGPQASQLEKGPVGQARQIGGAVRLLRRNRRRWHLRHVYWFTVTDAPGDEGCNFCDSAGLFTFDFKPKLAWSVLTASIR